MLWAGVLKEHVRHVRECETKRICQRFCPELQEFEIEIRKAAAELAGPSDRLRRWIREGKGDACMQACQQAKMNLTLALGERNTGLGKVQIDVYPCGNDF